MEEDSRGVLMRAASLRAGPAGLGLGCPPGPAPAPGEAGAAGRGPGAACHGKRGHGPGSQRGERDAGPGERDAGPGVGGSPCPGSARLTALGACKGNAAGRRLEQHPPNCVLNI